MGDSTGDGIGEGEPTAEGTFPVEGGNWSKLGSGMLQGTKDGSEIKNASIRTSTH